MDLETIELSLLLCSCWERSIIKYNQLMKPQVEGGQGPSLAVVSRTKYTIRISRNLLLGKQFVLQSVMFICVNTSLKSPLLLNKALQLYFVVFFSLINFIFLHFFLFYIYPILLSTLNLYVYFQCHSYSLFLALRLVPVNCILFSLPFFPFSFNYTYPNQYCLQDFI